MFSSLLIELCSGVLVVAVAVAAVAAVAVFVVVVVAISCLAFQAASAFFADPSLKVALLASSYAAKLCYIHVAVISCG